MAAKNGRVCIIFNIVHLSKSHNSVSIATHLMAALKSADRKSPGRPRRWPTVSMTKSGNNYKKDLSSISA